MSEITGERTEGRFGWVDACKGIAISLMVFGHVLRGLRASGILRPEDIQYVDDWIYSFHMPLFFLLSGLFLPRAVARPLGDTLASKLRTIAYPYFLWSIITILVKAPLSGYVNHQRSLDDLVKIPYMPMEQFWFLYVLFLAWIAIAILSKLGLRTWMILIISVAIVPELHLLPASPWIPADLVRANMVFVALGMLLGERGAVGRLERVGPRWTVPVALGGFAIVTVFAIPSLHRWDASRVPVALIGSAAGIALAAGLTHVPRVGETLRMWGRYSLEIYLVHTLASAGLRVALQKVFRYDGPVGHIILGTVVGIYAPILLAYCCRRISLDQLFTLRAPAAPRRPPATSMP